MAPLIVTNLSEKSLADYCERQHHAKLLDRPLRRGMLGDIPVEDPARADLKNNENREDAESGPLPS